MPVTITANGTSDPPQYEITIATPDGSAMASVTLYRQVGGILTQTRVQPIAGLASRFITDPEAPWDTPVAYVAAMTYGSGGASSTTDTSAQATLTPTPAAIWAIHPTVPVRSMPIDAASFAQLGIAAAGDLVYAAQAVQHPILGSKVPILTKLGSRRGAVWSLDLTSMTLDERTQLLALLDDETPLLLRAPAAWAWGLDEGYYAVGDVTEARRLQYGPEPSRTIRLPLTKVAAPAGTQQSNWSWGGLLAGYADWPAVRAAFADWNAVAADTPR